MAQLKTKRTWRPSPLERRVREAARLTAEREAARIPWPRLHEARENYVEWEAFALWVRAIEDAERDFPEWLAKVRSKTEASILAGLPKEETEIAGPLSIPPRMVAYLLSRPGWIPRL